VNLGVRGIGLVTIESLYSLKDDAFDGGVLIHIDYVGNVKKLWRIVVHIFDVHGDGKVATLKILEKVFKLKRFLKGTIPIKNIVI